MTTIRPVVASDEAAWRRLWAGYIAFQQGTVAPGVTDHTWLRLLDGRLIGRVAVRYGAVCGFTVSLLHEGTWAMTPYCYLEDLFVDGSVRGQGIGRALIQDLIGLGHDRSWSRVYWHTRSGNSTARALYDRFVSCDGDVRYRIEL